MEREKTPTREYIEFICNLYGDVYDDRIEDCRPPAAGDEIRNPGADWVPGQIASHKSLAAFQKELKTQGIEMSSSKLRKILITGGCWTTERSREIAELFELYTSSVEDGGKGVSEESAKKKISKDLGISIVTVSVNLPYQDVVYKLKDCSSNAKRCARYRDRKTKL